MTVLKNRYGEADVEIGVNFFGKCGIWKELPKPDEIYDYERYTNPNYILKNDIVDEPNSTDIPCNNFNLTL